MMNNSDIKLLWVASMPRTGSMWVFNVLREWFQRHRFNVYPKVVPQSDSDMFEAAHVGMEDDDPNSIWILKVHSKLPTEAARSRFISPRRDPRDALISYMKFMQCDFDTALKAMRGSIQICDHYSSFPKNLCLPLEYQSIVNTPADTLADMLVFLGIEPSTDELLSTVGLFTREKVRKRTIANQRGIIPLHQSGVNVNNRLVQLSQDSIRVFDPTTGFQTNHISGYQDGEWRTELSPEQLDAVERDLTPWAIANGHQY
jgi:hypothetical protein